MAIYRPKNLIISNSPRPINKVYFFLKNISKINKNLKGFVNIKVINTTAHSLKTNYRVLVGTKYINSSLQWEIPPLPKKISQDDITKNFGTIYSKIVTPNKYSPIYNLKLEPSGEDFWLTNVILREKNNNQDTTYWAKNLKIVNSADGSILGEGRMIRGIANFKLKERLSIPREKVTNLTFLLKPSKSINTQNWDTTFHPIVNFEDLTLIRKINGAELHYSHFISKHHYDSNFLITNSKPVISYPQNQKFAIKGSGAFEDFFKFEIANIGDFRELTLRRLSFEIITNDDLKFKNNEFSRENFSILYRRKNEKSWHETRSNLTIDNNIIKVDIDRSIYKNKTLEFKLQGKFSQQGNSYNNKIYVKILNDNNPKKGKVDYLRSEAANFIWSDQSLLSRHNNSSNDYLNGFLIQKTNQVFQTNSSNND
jgi:hypothetical protein